MSEEEIKLINETMQLDYSQLVMSCVHLCMEKKKLKSQLQQKENIIKEVREYIEEWQRFPHTNGSTHKELANIIEILDKEKNNE